MRRFCFHLLVYRHAAILELLQRTIYFMESSLCRANVGMSLRLVTLVSTNPIQRFALDLSADDRALAHSRMLSSFSSIPTHYNILHTFLSLYIHFPPASTLHAYVLILSHTAYKRTHQRSSPHNKKLTNTSSQRWGSSPVQSTCQMWAPTH